MNKYKTLWCENYWWSNRTYQSVGTVRLTGWWYFFQCFRAWGISWTGSRLVWVDKWRWWWYYVYNWQQRIICLPSTIQQWSLTSNGCTTGFRMYNTVHQHRLSIWQRQILLKNIVTLVHSLSLAFLSLTYNITIWKSFSLSPDWYWQLFS